MNDDRTNKYTWMLVLGVILASSYVYALVAAGTATTIGGALLALVFFYAVAPVLTVAGGVLIVLYAVLSRKK